jgi:hypothetical protein
MQADLYRHQHKFLELDQLKAPEYMLDDLRALLKGKTWEDLCNASIKITPINGVHFTARLGCFLRRKAIAVVALNRIVAMRFITGSKLYPNFAFEAPLDGTRGSGFVLLQGDFMNGRLGDIKLTDLVIGEGDECLT